MANLAANPDVGRLIDNVGIAYGATIENAVGGSGNDIIIGNSASNRLTGNAGNDVMSGGDGVDFFTGGAGNDTFIADINGATVVAKRGPISLDVITDFQKGFDKIDLSGIDANMTLDGDQAFAFRGSSANKNMGDLTFKVLTASTAPKMRWGWRSTGLPAGAAVQHHRFRQCRWRRSGLRDRTSQYQRRGGERLHRPRHANRNGGDVGLGRHRHRLRPTTVPPSRIRLPLLI